MSRPSPRWRRRRSTTSLGQAAKAGAKAAGVVIDDTAVTPRYVVGFSAKRELPIVGKIAMGSLRNKLFVLLPAALLLSYFAAWAITPLLMIGGVYLCYEGAEKVYEIVVPHHAQAHEAQLGTVALNAEDPRGRKDRQRDQDRLHPVGRDHGDRARGHSGRKHLDAGAGAGGGRDRHHRRGLWRGGADREGRRSRRRAGAQQDGVRRSARRAARSGAGSCSACPIC